MTPEFIFDREEECQRIRQFIARRRPFLVFGPSGVGKTVLLRKGLLQFPSVLYCGDSATTNVMFRNLARTLFRLGNPRVRDIFCDEEAIGTKSAVSLKGIVIDALRQGEYQIVLDHLKRPSYAFASAVREVMGWGSTPVSSVARSSHMEDTGFLHPLYGDRSQKCEIENFDEPVAKKFAEEIARRMGLSGRNTNEFLQRVFEVSNGNPGAMISLIGMAMSPKYRSEEHIKISPLYIDYRMHGGAVR
jgi:hypothetical protein